MRTWVRVALHVSTVVVGASGVAYFWMKDLLTTDDPFAVVNHPLQPLMLAAHVLAAPALILAFGAAFESHIAGKLRARHIRANRRSGWIALVTFVIMTLSGYLLQVVTNPGIHRGALVAHLSSGALFLASYAAHLAGSLRRLRAAHDDERRSQMVA